MLGKLAVRNVKRQLGNYLIYFITVSFTVALMFAFNSMIFEKRLLALADGIAELRAGLIAVTVAVALIVAGVLGYATSFILKLRKREFGTYLTLGMTRRNILTLFAVETLVLCALSSATGIALGLGIYPGVMAIVTNVIEAEYEFGGYSVKGILLTLGIVAGVYALSSAASALYLRRVKIYSLIYGARKTQKTVKRPVLWLTVAVAALAAVISGCVLLDVAFKTLANGGEIGFSVTAYFVMVAAGIFVFHIAVARSVVGLLLRSKKIKSRSANTFTLRQLSGKLRVNSVMTGALAFLLAFSVIGANVSFAMKVSNNAELDLNYPFDISAEVECGDVNAVSVADAERIIEKYSRIERAEKYGVYTTGTQYLFGFTEWKGPTYEGITDKVMTESEFDRVYGAKGFAPVDLDGGFKIVVDPNHASGLDFSGATLDIGGARFEYKGLCKRFLLGYSYFVAVVPDSAAALLRRTHDGAVFDLERERYDGKALHDELSYTETFGGFGMIERCDFSVREYVRITSGASTAVFIVSALYIAVVFVFMAMAILALKTLSDTADDRLRFDILFRLGASEKTRKRALFTQIFCFFFLPFALPILMSVPAWLLCTRIMSLLGLAALTSHGISVASASIAAVMISIYALYFTATYVVAKRNVIDRAR